MSDQPAQFGSKEFPEGFWTWTHEQQVAWFGEALKEMGRG